MSSRRLLAVTLASFAVGAALMLLFEATIARVAGVLALFAFAVAGVFLLADPAALSAADDDDG